MTEDRRALPSPSSAEADAERDELTELLVAARDGDRWALSLVVRRLYPQIVRYCAVRVAPEEAEDVAQEVFLRVSSSLSSFRARATARTWVFAIARNTCVDAVRRRQRRRGREQLDDDPVASTGWSGPAADDGLALSMLLEQLDDDRQEAFVLTQVVGASYAEAAELLDVPIGTIRSRVARARQDLVGLLADD